MQAASSSWGPLLGSPLTAARAWQGPGKSAGAHPAPEPSSLPPEAAASWLIFRLSTKLGSKGRQTASGWGSMAACKAVHGCNTTASVGCTAWAGLVCRGGQGGNTFGGNTCELWAAGAGSWVGAGQLCTCCSCQADGRPCTDLPTTWACMCAANYRGSSPSIQVSSSTDSQSHLCRCSLGPTCTPGPQHFSALATGDSATQSPEPALKFDLKFQESTTVGVHHASNIIFKTQIVF